MYGTTVRTNGGYQTSITSRQHAWHADAPVEDGGTDTAATPEELLMGAIGACAAITAKMYADRKGWPLRDVVISLDMTRQPQENAPFAHEIREHIELIGDELTDEQRARIREIMKRCPVRRAIANPITYVETLLGEED